MRYTKIFATGLALTIAATSFATTAEARHRHRHHDGFPFAAGALGFAAGAFFGSALGGPRYYYDDYEPGYYYDEPRYYRQAPRVYYQEAPVYYREAPPVIYREAPGYSHPCDAPTGSSKPAWAMC